MHCDVDQCQFNNSGTLDFTLSLMQVALTFTLDLYGAISSGINGINIKVFCL